MHTGSRGSARLGRILCVEDEEDIRVVIRLTLGSVGGFTVRCCGSAEEAVGVAEEFAPDLVVLDVMMPTTDGPSTLSALRALPTLTETPVVFMTALVQPDEVDRLMALGALGVISKPFNPMALPRTLLDLWAKRP